MLTSIFLENPMEISGLIISITSNCKDNLELLCSCFDSNGKELDVVDSKNNVSYEKSIKYETNKFTVDMRLVDNLIFGMYVVCIPKKKAILSVTNGYTNNIIFKSKVGSTPQSVCVIFRERESTRWNIKKISSMFVQRDVIRLREEISQKFRKMFFSQNDYSLDSEADQSLKIGRGDTVKIPKLNKVRLGLGWDVGDKNIDVDSSCVLLEKGRITENVSFRNLESSDKAVVHLGDNLTGDGSGDDEEILIEINRLHANIDCLILTINIFTYGATFGDVKNLFARIVDDSNGHELIHFKIDKVIDCTTCNALVFAKIYRIGSVWRFMAIGHPCHGNTVEELYSELDNISSIEYKPMVFNTEIHSQAVDKKKCIIV